MLIGRLKETQISQSLLTSELKNSRDKYDECLTLYNEARVITVTYNNNSNHVKTVGVIYFY